MADERTLTLALLANTGRDEPLRIIPVPEYDTEALYTAVRDVMFHGEISEKQQREVAGVVGNLRHDGEHSFEDADLQLRTVLLPSPASTPAIPAELERALKWAQDGVDFCNADQGMNKHAQFLTYMPELITAATSSQSLRDENTALRERVKEYYLFSHGLFFRPEAKGYTGIRDQAGLFDKEYAENYCRGSCAVTMLHKDDAKVPETMPDTYRDLIDKHISYLKKQRDESASERDRMKRALEVAERCLKNIASTLHHNQDSRTAERTLAEISKIMGEK